MCVPLHQHNLLHFGKASMHINTTILLPPNKMSTYKLGIPLRAIILKLCCIMQGLCECVINPPFTFVDQ